MAGTHRDATLWTAKAPRTRRIGVLAAGAAAALVLAACGTEPTPDTAPDTAPVVGDAVELPTPMAEPGAWTAPDHDRPGPDRPGTERPGRNSTGTEDAGTTSRVVTGSPAATSGSTGVDPTHRPGQQVLDQPAIWPAPEVVFTTPEEAAADFASSLLVAEGDPLLGEFEQGDARSGEITVLFAGETGDLDPPLVRGRLVLRQIAPTDGWYVIAAIGEEVTIDAPSAAAEVTAGPVTVTGEATGPEGTVIVTAFPQGDTSAQIDLQIGAGGSFGDVEAYDVELDLTAVGSGAVVALLVRNDPGLETDPGGFAAIPIVVADAPTTELPPTS